MNVRWMMIVMALFIVLELISCVGAGQYDGNATIDNINRMTGYSYLESQGILGIPMMGATFFWNLPELLSFERIPSESSTGLQIIRALVMVISVGIVWGILQVFMPAAQGLVSKLFKL